MKKQILKVGFIFICLCIIMEVVDKCVSKPDITNGIDDLIIDSLYSDTSFDNKIGKLASFDLKFIYPVKDSLTQKFIMEIQGAKSDTNIQGEVNLINGKWEIVQLKGRE